MAKAGAEDIVTTIETDFTEASLSDPRLCEATMILCDPSCSGTGDAERDVKPPSSPPSTSALLHPSSLLSPARIHALAAQQQRILLRAMKFPRVRVVVYSTCSVLREENEDVVEAVLRQAAPEGWTLEPCLPSWPQRGVPSPSAADQGRWAQKGAATCEADAVASACVRASRHQRTGGFFVCRFERQINDLAPPMETREAVCTTVSLTGGEMRNGKAKKRRQKKRKRRGASEGGTGSSESGHVRVLQEQSKKAKKGLVHHGD